MLMGWLQESAIQITVIFYSTLDWTLREYTVFATILHNFIESGRIADIDKRGIQYSLAKEIICSVETKLNPARHMQSCAVINVQVIIKVISTLVTDTLLETCYGHLRC
jgi:hypothetical protein